MKRLFLPLIIFLCGIMQPFIIKGQVSFGGTPPSFGYEELRLTIPQYEVIVDFDVKRQLAEDDEMESFGRPPRCAKILPVNLNMINNGEWFTLPDGTWIWKLEIFAPQALAIMLHYDKFVIPEGGKLFIYNPDHSKVLGAYNENTNSFGAEFATEFVSGDKLILEYVSPPTDEMLIPQIEISGVAYGYNHLAVPAGNGLYRYRWDSEPCMLNINCSEGANWQTEKKGIARILMSSGGYVGLCSGTLINNTNCDFDPLFLTAYHCLDNMSSTDLNRSVFYFNYEDPGCPRLNIDYSSNTLTGVTYLIDLPISGSSDGALARFNNSIPAHYDIYLNGWD